MNPRVSVVVPAYRNVEYLAQTLDSILAQDYDDFELVVADHSSNDGTTELLARYAGHPKVRVLDPTPAGGGAKANWDRVSIAAHGELLKLVCGDDLIAPDALSRQVAALDAHPSAVLVASKRDLVDAHGKVVIAGRGLGPLKGLVRGRDAVRASVLAGTNLFGEPGCVMFRRELLVQAGGWDNSHPYLIDQASYSAIMLQGDMVALRESLASFRINAGQWSVRLMNDQAQQAIDFHNALAAADPQLLSPMTLRVGNLKARLMAQARRLTYLWLGRRMGAA
ncbi:glycosyltransferase family 2 protein [Stenotrophomonas maltophilia]|nr:glycosyltransferase family 2 protein [Stenotrophomonas maltophilia]MBA0467963.1 glycosyltransferase family 2 protein [Stenotrophomonas maltophilia]MBA0477103.1 glycosyltransferase family 2 protein [Stenotrophomonas maltophilia]MBA0484568.1 glycosyltransferase family 2 protein [Stenotrophomonas maltophilia]